MLKIIFFTEIVIYLIVMPALHGGAVLGYNAPIDAAILALLATSIGVVAGSIGRARSDAGDTAPSQKLQPRSFLAIVVPVASALYAIIVIVFGLLNRRQGSEFMAELYAGLPIYALLILRTYEILLVPLIVIYVFGARSSKLHQYTVILSIILALPFTGLLDSRGRLLIILIFLMCLTPSAIIQRMLVRRARFYIGAVIAVGAFILFSNRRAEAYASINDYLLFEVYERLDGLNLVTDLRDSGHIDRWGQFDLRMFSPFISKIPFLGASREAKMIGQTSTKQYYLQEVLGRAQLDTANSMIADPLYFMGWAGIIICFGLLGYAIARLDVFVNADRLMRGREKTALAIAFVTSFALIENDMAGCLIALVQNFLFTYVLLLLGTRQVTIGATTRLGDWRTAYSDASTA